MNGLSLTRGIFLCNNNNNDKNNGNGNNDNKYNNKNDYINNLPRKPNCEQTLFNEVYFSMALITSSSLATSTTTYLGNLIVKGLLIHSWVSSSHCSMSSTPPGHEYPPMMASRPPMKPIPGIMPEMTKSFLA